MNECVERFKTGEEAEMWKLGAKVNGGGERSFLPFGYEGRLLSLRLVKK